MTSYLNLAVRLVEMFAGDKLAAMTAKSLLIDMNRTSQASYAKLLDDHGHVDSLVARAQQRMEATLQQGFRLSELAAWLAVSERTLNRHFKQAVGLAPLTYLQNLRVEVAKQLLESRPIGLEIVSQRVGYGDISTFRELFKRKTGLSPSEYRKCDLLALPWQAVWNAAVCCMARLIDSLGNRIYRIPLVPHLQAVARTRQRPALTQD